MRAPRICVAGLRTDGSGHLRPVARDANSITRSMLRSEGGVFTLGAKVELGELLPRTSPPRVEDHLFWPDRARMIEVVEPDDYLSRIDAVCREDLGAIFGPSLRRDGWGFSVPEGEGNASLGCLRVPAKARAKLEVERRKVTVRLSDSVKPVYLTVTDIRCYEGDEETPKAGAVENAQRRLDRGVPLRLMVGLGYPWAPTGEVPRHWLQVNGLCLEDYPLGDRYKSGS